MERAEPRMPVGGVMPFPARTHTARSRGRARFALVLGLVALQLVLIAGTAGVADARSSGRVRGVARIAEFPILGRFDIGTNLLLAQYLLRSRDRYVRFTADFSPSTQWSLRAFQREHRIRDTGLFDQRTWVRLTRTIRRGDEGWSVVGLQETLNRKMRWDLPTDGVFGPQTVDAVRRFQRTVGLRQTGVVDQRTWRVLAWHYERPNFALKSLCDYSTINGPEANWATSSVIAWIEEASRIFYRRTGRPMAIGDLSYRFGGRLPGHQLHHRGMEADIRPARDDGRQCATGTDYRTGIYDPGDTRQIVNAVRSAAGKRILLIAFNDPRLKGTRYVRWAPGHDDHIHVTFCRPGHPDRLYDCVSRPGGKVRT